MPTDLPAFSTYALFIGEDSQSWEWRWIAGHIPHLLVTFTVLYIAFRLVRSTNRPGSLVAWLMAIFLLPYFAIPFYFLFGSRKISPRKKRKTNLYPQTETTSKSKTKTKTPPSTADMALRTHGAPPPMGGNRIRMTVIGEEAYKDLMSLIDGANHSICIMTFILGRDEFGSEVVRKLAQKAREGVQVRLLLDGFGSFWSSGRFVDPLREAGGKIGIFLPILPLGGKWSAHLRNHRKLAIADHCKAIVGGMNLGSQYMGHSPNQDRWTDCSLHIEGPVVAEIHQIFSSDWEFATGETLPPIDVPKAYNVHSGGALLQVAGSGPDVPGDPLVDAMLLALAGAQKRIWIVTPYFIPDPAMVRFLSVMARMGRDVRILLPKVSNHYLADLARGYYLRELREAGVKILGFNKGMLHAKLMLVDESVAMVGSANFDMRSLYLNYELMVFIYSDTHTRKVERNIKRLMENSGEIPEPKKNLAGRLRVWAEDLSRTFAPFL